MPARRNFRHPLLLAEYLRRKSELERALRQAPGAKSSGFIRSSSLSTRKAAMYTQAGLGQEGNSGGGAEELERQLGQLQPPRALDLTIKPDISAVVITGPNTGGKTATIKAFGLAVCMAKAGLPVPASAPARLPCFSAVLADIGDEQSLTANLSTFSGHLKRIQGLRAEADGKALILLDELGTGGWAAARLTLHENA